MTVGWNSQVRIRPREMGKQVGTNIWSSSARLEDEKELRMMTFFFLSFLKKSTPLVISKALTDNSRRVTMTPKVFNKMKTFDTRGDKYFSAARLPPSAHVAFGAQLSLPPSPQNIVVSTLGPLHQVVQLYLFMRALVDCMNILIRCICGEPFLYRVLD